MRRNEKEYSRRSQSASSLLTVLAAVALVFLAAYWPLTARAGDAEVLLFRGDEDYPPYEFLENGKPTGFNVEILRAVAKIMGLNVDIRLGPWSEVRAQAEADEIDGLTGMYYSLDRDKLMDFSAPHLRVYHSIFTIAGTGITNLADLHGKTIIVQRGDIMHDYALTLFPPESVLAVPTQGDALRILEMNPKAVALLATLQGLYNVERYGLANIVTVGPPIEPRDYCFAVPEGRDALLAQLNEGLAIARRTGAYREIYDKWFGRYAPPGFLERWGLLIFGGVAAVMALLVLVIFWGWTLRRTVALRTAELRHELAGRAEAESALEKSEKRYRRLVENAGDAFFLSDTWGRILDVNQAACDSLGYSSVELLGMNIADIGPDYRPEMRRFWISRLEQEHLMLETRLRRKDGVIFPVEIKGVAFVEDGETLVFGIVRDVTIRKRMEEELVRARDEAEAANQAKSRFLANMSHEIRTPLNGMMGMLQLMRETSLNSEQQEYANEAIQSCERLTRLLGDVLDISRIESMKMQLLLEPFELAEEMRTLAVLFGPSARQKSLRLEVQIEPGGPTWFLGDAPRLQQVLSNLVGNSLKYTEKGSISVRVRAALQPGGKTCRIHFQVSDTGLGMSKEMLRRLYEPFAQEDMRYTRQYQGAGLGLSIVKNLVDLMGGEIQVQSVKGQGTTFDLQIPFVVTEAPAAVESTATNETVDVTPFHRVLVAEDDRVNLITIRRFLEKRGFEVEGVGNGQAALDLLRKKNFDVIFMDIQMPVMDGLEATRRIRSDPEFADKTGIPIVALTAYAMEGDRERFMAEGMNGYLAKPVSMEDLLALLERLGHS